MRKDAASLHFRLKESSENMIFPWNGNIWKLKILSFHKFSQDENSIFNRVLLNFELRKYYLYIYLQGVLKNYWQIYTWLQIPNFIVNKSFSFSFMVIVRILSHLYFHECLHWKQECNFICFFFTVFFVFAISLDWSITLYSFFYHYFSCSIKTLIWKWVLIGKMSL